MRMQQGSGEIEPASNSSHLKGKKLGVEMTSLMQEQKKKRYGASSEDWGVAARKTKNDRA